jgi:hypothetical protein
MQEQQQAYGQGLGFLGQASGMRAQDLAEASGLLGAGYTPEQRELARAGALFGAGMTQEQADLARAGTLQQASYMPRAQDLAMAQGMLGIGYTPQQQMLEALGLGTKTAGLADVGRRTGAELFGQLGQTGLETLMQGAELAQGLEASKRQSLTEALLGREPTMQEQLLANYLKVPVPQNSGGFISSGLNWLGNQLGIVTPSTSSTSSALSFPQLPTTSIGQPIPSGVNNIGSYLQGLSQSATGSNVGGMLSTPIVPTSGGTTGGSAFPSLPSYSLGQYSTGTPPII